jgi:hypothetical protein
MPPDRAAVPGQTRPFVEMFASGAFGRLLARDPAVELQARHDGAALASTADGSLDLWEDDAGLAFRASVAADLPVRAAPVSVQFLADAAGFARTRGAAADVVTIRHVRALPHIALLAEAASEAPAHPDAVAWMDDDWQGLPLPLQAVRRRWHVGYAARVLRRNKPAGRVLKLPPDICAVIDAELARREGR